MQGMPQPQELVADQRPESRCCYWEPCNHLMIAVNEEHILGVLHLQGQQEPEGLQGVQSPHGCHG